uniref:NADH-ubiquinone oxidoreductase chain 3 n=1 Tax=Lamprigera yunnana TaxID=370605 RepID=A0A5C0PXJ3_9COLE|nr:NADH dehydrogenase subunit 3 [Lamprigera yunnana]QEJ81506.1 NADH dehydrogenase subunit 3 [Lamprigera yunnana]
MLIMIVIMMIILLLSLLMMLTTSIISMKMIMDREKSSPFECGFDPLSSARMPFSLQFFLIAVIFLIFDVEITLLLPIIMAMKISNIYSFMFISMLFIYILLIGLFHEWNQGSLNWSY